METAEDQRSEAAAEPRPPEVSAIQACGWLLELSPDWIVLRASENIHRLLGESHVTLIDEPLGRFVHAQALHDLRNLFSRLSGTTGIARAYGVRLTDDPVLVDIAFQLRDGRVLLEAVPAAGAFGECFGTVGGLVSGLAQTRGQALLENAARRMRALTGYDRVTLVCGGQGAQSSRGAFDAGDMEADVPTILSDAAAEPVAIFPRDSDDGSVGDVLMRACTLETGTKLKECGISACMKIPFTVDGIEGEFRCDSRRVREPSFELHAAAELFAQLFAMRWEIDRLKSGD